MTHEESWNQNFELLKAYIEEHHHLPDKKKVENRGLLSWAKYQVERAYGRKESYSLRLTIVNV